MGSWYELPPGRRRWMWSGQFSVGGLILVLIGIYLLAGQFFPFLNDVFLLIVGVSLLAGYVGRRRVGFLIGGAILTGLGLGIFLGSLPAIPDQYDGALPMAGLAMGFLAIWLALGRANGAGRWAWYPGMVFLAIAGLIVLASFAVAEPRGQFIWPAILIGIGVWLLLRRRRRW